ncbi:MAG: hypothetical protein ACJ0GM_00810 [Parasynechococcus sp.]
MAPSNRDRSGWAMAARWQSSEKVSPGIGVTPKSANRRKDCSRGWRDPNRSCVITNPSDKEAMQASTTRSPSHL